MLVPKRAAADRVGLILAFLISSTESELIDEIHRRRSLTVGSDLAAEALLVIFANAVDVQLREERQI